MATATANEPAWHPPALCAALEPVDEIRGQKNINKIWAGEVLVLEGPHHGTLQRCVFKLLDPTTTLPVELACALTASLLGNDVPQPCLVQANAAELPGCPQDLHGKTLLLFGSTYLTQDSFFEQLAAQDNDTALNAAVWRHYCNEAPRAAKGAALDELISNFDRHMRNLRFDGTKWWLIDHDMSLLQTHHKELATLPATFTSHRNQIAAELLDRRCNDHDMATAARRSSNKARDLMALATVAGRWSHALPELQDAYQRTAALLTLLARRLPMLEQMIGARIGTQDASTLQWKPPTLPQNPTPSP